MDSDNPSGADNQQETERDPQRLHARRRSFEPLKIQSELHGDMQSHAEMTWPTPAMESVTTLPKVMAQRAAGCCPWRK
jgi:hypothetical protein